MDNSTGFGQPVIAVRIKDGIFVGNVTAAHDEDFLFMNKICGIVNCAGSEVKDMYESSIQYLTFPWKDSGANCSTVLFDSADRNIEQIVRFIDKCLETGDCVLVHSYYGLSRSCAVVIAYLMVKYGWNLENAEDFVRMAHAEINIKPYFQRQLKAFARRHAVPFDCFDTRVDDSHFALDNDQWMLRNTYINGLTSDVQRATPLYAAAASQIQLCELGYKPTSKRRRRLQFCDTKQGTSVGSTATAPLLQGRFVDPVSGTRTLPNGQSPAPSIVEPTGSILARRGTPNRRRLESTTDVNAKGRQVLVLKEEPPRNQPQVAASTVSMGTQPMTTPNRYANPYAGVGDGPQPMTAAPTPQPLVSGPAVGTTGSGQNISLRGGGTVLSAGGAAPPRTLGQLYAQQQVPNANATITPISQPQQQPIAAAQPAQTAGTTGRPSSKHIASAYANLSSQGTVRRSSPLPVQRTSAAAGGPASTGRYTAGSSSTYSAGISSLLPQSNPAASRIASGRAQSPMANDRNPNQNPVHPAVAAESRQPPLVRTASPLGRAAPGPAAGSSSNTYGAAVHTLQAPNRSSPTPMSSSSGGGLSSSPYGNGSSPSMYGSSTPTYNTQVPYAGTTVTSFRSSAPVSAYSATAMSNASSSGAQQRASSPQVRQNLLPSSSATSSARPAAGLSPRTGSPIGLRAGTTTLQSSGRPGTQSPRSLADQYLGAASNNTSMNQVRTSSPLSRRTLTTTATR